MTYRPLTILTLFALAMLALALAASCGGCAPSPIRALGSIPIAGGEVERAGAYIVSVQAAIEAAKPHADAVGQSALALASQASANAAATVKQVGATLGKVQGEFNVLSGQVAPLKEEIKKLKSSFWFRLGAFVNWCWWSLITLCVVHYVCIGAAMLIQIFWPAGESLAKVLAWIGKLIWPVGWAISILGYFEKRAAAKKAAAVITFIQPQPLA